MTSREPLLTPAQAGERCRICAKTVLRAIHAGGLRAYRLGEKAAYRIAIEDLEAWIERSVVTPAPPAPGAARPTALPLCLDEQPSVGRLKLTPEMGANRRAQSL
jgi:excisionase family DNA binding protein